MALNIREIDIFRPYPEEFPYELFETVGLDEGDYARAVAAKYVRIAKKDEEVLGVYSLHPDTAEQFTLYAVVVARGSRKQGLGRWLVGHAIGITESKGGRRVHVPCRAQRRFFATIGFVEDGAGQRYDLVPE